MQPILNPTASAVADNKVLNVYALTKNDAPLVIEIAFFAQPDILFEKCRRADCPPFNLLSISGLNWDQELSPWPYHWCIEPNDDFTGEAGNFLQFILNTALPFAFKTLGRSDMPVILSGYSMGGLFSLWAGYICPNFDKLVCVSGSVWYPDFLAYTKTHAFVKKPAAVYLSLGDTESTCQNPYLRTTAAVMKALFEDYTAQGIPCVYQINPGDHYTDPMGRLAKGLKWAIEH